MTVWICALIAVTTFAAHGSSFNSHAAQHAPHPELVNLRDNEAIDLGPYECESRAPKLGCFTIFDYSRLNYDPFNHRFVVFGGGHAATGRTDIDSFDINTLSWKSLYPTMSCEEIAEGDIDPKGFHRKTGHPVARHSYDQNVIAEFDGQGWLLMFSKEGFSGYCHRYKATISAVAAFPLTDPGRGWTYHAKEPIKWPYAGSAEYDPVSGLVVLLNNRATHMWVYDPISQKVVASKHFQEMKAAKDSSNLVFNPRDRNMYFIGRRTLQVRRLQLDRGNWNNTTMVQATTAGPTPPEMRNFAYDSQNHVIGGVSEGTFYALDLNSFTWLSQPIKATSDAGKQIGTVHSHAIDYDPVNNVFVFVSGRKPKQHTWAYRFRN